ncbi:hypothetical protein VPNG_08101 [Cytospora leucostoma]|uniref:Uncharacterized protein n=1 Tax=Cytospora leucostoma TaxID=1230097 RepID=A0A423WRV3_9PEZI|nr:hypothetical protein VPNG_08101 [Cytospora leucostoma]
MADNDQLLMSGALGSPKVHSATTDAARRFQSTIPAYLDDKVRNRNRNIGQGTQLPRGRQGLYSARINPTTAAAAAEDHDGNEPNNDGDIMMDDYDADFPGIAPDVHQAQFEPGVPADHTAAEAAEALRRSKTIYNPRDPSQDDQADADADGVALGVVPDLEGRRWLERRMRLARAIHFVDGPAIDEDDVPAPLASYLDLGFERDGAVVLAPVVKGGQGKEGLGPFLGARPGPRGVELRKRREVVGGDDDGADEVGAAADYYGGGHDVADHFHYEFLAANAAMRPGEFMHLIGFLILSLSNHYLAQPNDPLALRGVCGWRYIR